MFDVYRANWLVETWDDRTGAVKEKLAYCNSFACAEAAVKRYPFEHITFRHGLRVIREHHGKWTPEAARKI